MPQQSSHFLGMLAFFRDATEEWCFGLPRLKNILFWVHNLLGMRSIGMLTCHNPSLTLAVPLYRVKGLCATK